MKDSNNIDGSPRLVWDSHFVLLPGNDRCGYSLNLTLKTGSFPSGHRLGCWLLMEFRQTWGGYKRSGGFIYFLFIHLSQQKCIMSQQTVHLHSCLCKLTFFSYLKSVCGVLHLWYDEQDPVCVMQVTDVTDCNYLEVSSASGLQFPFHHSPCRQHRSTYSELNGRQSQVGGRAPYSNCWFKP